jgi:hypothetical protein
LRIVKAILHLLPTTSKAAVNGNPAYSRLSIIQGNGRGNGRDKPLGRPRKGGKMRWWTVVSAVMNLRFLVPQS